MASSADGEGEFDNWLPSYLDSVNVDGEVFAGYISGTLRTLEGAAPSEVEDSLLEVLQSCVEDEATCLTVCRDIQAKWKKESDRKQAAEQVKESVSTLEEADVPGEVASAEEGPGGATRGGLSSEEKQKLLEQYGCESDGEDNLADHSESGGGGGVFVNVNTSVASEAQRLHRELLKAGHEAKVERDRKSREAQKQKAQERKEKEKKRTQKQERRR